MNFACCAWALSGSDETVLADLAGLGFRWIDIQPHTFTAPAAQAKMTELGLSVSCLGASFGLPEGVTLDNPDSQAQAMAHVSAGLAYAAKLGATTAYVVPGLDSSPTGLACYSRSLTAAADRAAELGLKLGVEHFPGKALPTAAGTLDFLQEIGHPNLYLLFDIGHVQMSGEDPAETILAAGSRLGYVHLDDNDGEGDLHWALTDGILTEATLERTFAALVEAGYEGAVSLELSPNLPDPLEALRRSRQVVTDYFS